MHIRNAPIFIAIFLGASLGMYFFVAYIHPDKNIACTAEAKICPDGTAVGRTGPNCEFAKCPGEDGVVANFEDCAAAGNPIMESYPRQCRDVDGNLFVEDIGNELEKSDLIRINSPRPGAIIESPLTIKGQARGMWFFEASFPIILTDWDGRIIAQHYATAKGDWMTEEFVPFESTLEFESPYTAGMQTFMQKGTLILKKDNPSGLPEHDDALEIPIQFAPRAVNGNVLSGIRGVVLLGPQCPVVREGEECPDKPYQTNIRIYRGYGTDDLAVSVFADANGEFEADLPPGEYTVTADGSRPFPSCESIVVSIREGRHEDVTLSCDTGIR